MDFLVQAAVSNAVIVSVLAPIVLAVNRASRRPALTHRLWLLLLIKLVTPPLMPITLPSPIDSSSSRTAAAAVPPAELSKGRSKPIGDGPADSRVGRPPPLELDGDPSGPPPRVSGLVQAAAWHVALNWGRSLAGIWLAVSGYMLAFTSIQLMRVRRRLGAVSLGPPEVQDMAREIARNFGLDRAPSVCFLPEIISPATRPSGAGGAMPLRGARTPAVPEARPRAVRLRTSTSMATSRLGRPRRSPASNPPATGLSAVPAGRGTAPAPAVPAAMASAEGSGTVVS